MKYTLIAVSSITYAMKGMGYYCEIEKTPKNLSSGCGYSIRVKDSSEVIIGILKNNGIEYKALMSVNR